MERIVLEDLILTNLKKSVFIDSLDLDVAMDEIYEIIEGNLNSNK